MNLIVIWPWEMPGGSRAVGQIVSPTINSFVCLFVCVCVCNTVGMPGVGNKGITPSPKNTHVSPKKYTFVHSVRNWGNKRGGSQSFSPHSESFNQQPRVSDVSWQVFTGWKSTRKDAGTLFFSPKIPHNNKKISWIAPQRGNTGMKICAAVFLFVPGNAHD